MTIVDDSHLGPAQAVFRFTLELAALAGWAMFGWHLADGPVRFVLAIVFPTLAATLWGTFRAPGDHSAGGAPVTVPGPVRLVIELDVLLGAAVATAIVWNRTFGLVLGVAVVAHYATTMPRVRWLLERRA